MTLNFRIKEIRREFCNNSTKVLAQKLGVSSQAVSNYVRDGYNIGREVIENLLSVYPNIDANWLLSGKGNMLKQTSEGGVVLHNIGNGNIASAGSISNVKNIQGNDSEKIKELELLLIERDAEIKSLKNTIEILIQSIKR